MNMTLLNRILTRVLLCHSTLKQISLARQVPCGLEPLANWSIELRRRALWRHEPQKQTAYWSTFTPLKNRQVST